MIDLAPPPIAASERKAPCGIIGGACLDTTWQTPQEYLVPARGYWGGSIPFDVCTALDNPTKADDFWTEADNALGQDWPASWWCNPPYGKAIRLWLAKMRAQILAHEINEGIALLPCSRWEQHYFQVALTAANVVCFIRKRVDFLNPKTGDIVSGNTYANMYVGFNVDYQRFVSNFSEAGLCVAVKALNEPPVHGIKAKRGKRRRVLGIDAPPLLTFDPSPPPI